MSTDCEHRRTADTNLYHAHGIPAVLTTCLDCSEKVDYRPLREVDLPRQPRAAAAPCGAPTAKGPPPPPGPCPRLLGTPQLDPNNRCLTVSGPWQPCDHKYANWCRNSRFRNGPSPHGPCVCPCHHEVCTPEPPRR